MVVQKPSKLRRRFSDRLIRLQRCLKIGNKLTNLCMFRQKSHEEWLPIQPNVPRPCWQQHLFLLPEMLLPAPFPEPQKLSHDDFQRFVPCCSWLFERVPDEERFHQREVVVLAERVQCDVTFHS